MEQIDVGHSGEAAGYRGRVYSVVVGVEVNDMKPGWTVTWVWTEKCVDGIRQTTAKLEAPVVRHKDQNTWTEK